MAGLFKTNITRQALSHIGQVSGAANLARHFMQLIECYSSASLVDGSAESANKSSNALECSSLNLWIRLNAGSDVDNVGVQPDLCANGLSMTIPLLPYALAYCSNVHSPLFYSNRFLISFSRCLIQQRLSGCYPEAYVHACTLRRSQFTAVDTC